MLNSTQKPEKPLHERWALAISPIDLQTLKAQLDTLGNNSPKDKPEFLNLFNLVCLRNDPEKLLAFEKSLETEISAEIKEEQELQRSIENGTDAILELLQICEERIDFGQCYMAFVQHYGKDAKIIKDYLEMLGLQNLLKVSEMNMSRLQADANADMQHYLEIRRFIISGQSDNYLLCFLYAYVKSRLLRWANTKLGKDNPNNEYFHFKRMEKILKPFLPESFEHVVEKLFPDYDVTQELEIHQRIENELRKVLFDHDVFKKKLQKLPDSMLSAPIKTFISELNETADTIKTLSDKTQSDGNDMRKVNKKIHIASDFLAAHSAFQLSAYMNKLIATIGICMDFSSDLKKISGTVDALLQEAKKTECKKGNVSKLTSKTESSIVDENQNAQSSNENSDSDEKKTNSPKEECLIPEDLVLFRKQKEDELKAYKEEVKKNKARNEKLKAKRQMLFDATNPFLRYDENADLSSTEIEQLQEINQRLNRRMELLDGIFGKTLNAKISFKDLEAMIKYVFSELGGSLSFNKSSHFEVILPNVRKTWPKAPKEAGYDYNEMSRTRRYTVRGTSWHPHGHSHNDGNLSDFAKDRVCAAFTNAGITPERLLKAQKKCNRASV